MTRRSPNGPLARRCLEMVLDRIRGWLFAALMLAMTASLWVAAWANSIGRDTEIHYLPAAALWSVGSSGSDDNDPLTSNEDRHAVALTPRRLNAGDRGTGYADLLPDPAPGRPVDPTPLPTPRPAATAWLDTGP